MPSWPYFCTGCCPPVNHGLPREDGQRASPYSGAAKSMPQTRATLRSQHSCGFFYILPRGPMWPLNIGYKRAAQACCLIIALVTIDFMAFAAAAYGWMIHIHVYCSQAFCGCGNREVTCCTSPDTGQGQCSLARSSQSRESNHTGRNLCEIVAARFLYNV
jgi:hypothetical protein